MNQTWKEIILYLNFLALEMDRFDFLGQILFNLTFKDLLLL